MGRRSTPERIYEARRAAMISRLTQVGRKSPETAEAFVGLDSSRRRLLTVRSGAFPSWKYGAVLRSITLGFALSALAAACALVETQPLRGSVQVGLAQWGQEFTPGRAPDTGVVPRAAVLGHIEGFPEDAPNPVATEPVFGTIRCVIVAKCPGPPRETPALGPIPVWLVEFPNVPRGNGGHAWAVVDAATGNMYFDSDTRPP